MGRDGISPEHGQGGGAPLAHLIGCMLMQRGDADALLCGLVGRYDHHLEHVRDVIGLRAGCALLCRAERADAGEPQPLHHRHLRQRGAERRGAGRDRAMAVDELRRFGLPPRVAFLSHSMFGSSAGPVGPAHARGARPVRRCCARAFECDGEMHGDAALSEDIRRSYLPETTLDGEANLLVLPNLDAANILFNVLKMTGGQGVTVGPMLLGHQDRRHPRPRLVRRPRCWSA
jgi:malate dehydrogenase (oxaloacetate-decarboxylating)(NADP+)